MSSLLNILDADKDVRRRERLIVVLALIMACIALLFIPVVYIFQPNPVLMVSIAIGLGVFGTVIVLARRGKIELAVFLLTAFLVIAPPGTMLAAQIIGPAPLALLFSILVASLLLKPWQIGIVLLIDLIGLFGVLPFLPATELTGEFDQAVLVSSSIMLVMVTFISFLNARLIRLSLTTAQHAVDAATTAKQALEEQHHVLERTNDDLRHALQTANSAVTLKTQFVAMVSHELRTPLTSIMGYTDMMRMGLCGTLSNDQYDAVAQIHESSQHLLRLIEDLLSFAELETSKPILHTNEVMMAPLLDAIVRTYAPQAHAKGVVFETVIDPALPTSIYSDQRSLEQILMNLLSNAIKFTMRGRIILRIAAVPIQQYVSPLDTHDLKQLVIEVEDTGIGIRAEDLETIFEPFRRIAPHITGSRGGTGLGLAITQHLVTLMDGSMQVTSEPGRGSCFTVTLPMRKAASVGA